MGDQRNVTTQAAETPWDADDPVVAAQAAPAAPVEAPASGSSLCSGTGADADVNTHLTAALNTPVSEHSEDPDSDAPHASDTDDDQDAMDEADADDDVDVADDPESLAVAAPTPPGSAVSTWTIPLICLGIGLIACCLLVPAADDNRRLAYEKEKLRHELEYVNQQVAVNDAFIRKLADDPTLAERLATRQMKLVRAGAQVLELRGQPRENLSPFLLITVPPPAPLPEYQPVGGLLARLCRHPKTQLYTIGTGLLMVAVGLVLSANPRRDDWTAGRD